MKAKLLLVIFAGLFIIIFYGGCAWEGFVSKAAVIPIIAGASYTGDETCLECHDDMVGFKKTIHGRIADFEVVGLSKGCESCHGPGSIHVEDEDPASVINFKDISKGEASAVCLECHTSGSLMDWQGSEHSLNDVSCIDCHRAHSRYKGFWRSLSPSCVTIVTRISGQRPCILRTIPSKKVRWCAATVIKPMAAF